jgi:hypothetical protein
MKYEIIYYKVQYQYLVHIYRPRYSSYTARTEESWCLFDNR